MTGIYVKYSAACLSSYTIQHSQEMLHVQNLKVQAILNLTHQVSILLGQDLCCIYATLHNSLLILWDVWSFYCWIWRSVFQNMTLFGLVDMDQCFRGTCYSAKGGSRYLCNNGELLPDYMVSHATFFYCKNNCVHVATLFAYENKLCNNALILQFVIHINTKHRNTVFYMCTRILNLLQYNLCVLSSAPVCNYHLCYLLLKNLYTCKWQNMKHCLPQSAHIHSTYGLSFQI
jgi:hypothetical protein